MLGFLKNAFGWVRRRKDEQRDISIVLLGVDNAGKTTMLHAMKGELDPVVVPSIGFSRPLRVSVGSYNVTVFDLGGDSRFRGIWKDYFSEVHGAIFVVDSADPGRLAEARAELHACTQDPRVDGKPILVLANKQDLPSAMLEVDVALHLELDRIVNCRHSILKCVARGSCNGGMIDERIRDGLQWLADAIHEDFVQLSSRVQREQSEKKEGERKRMDEQKRRVERRLARREQGLPEDSDDEAAAAPTAAAAAAAGGAAPASGGAAGSEGEAPVIRCKNCSTRPAVKKCAASNWHPVCAECAESLTLERQRQQQQQQQQQASTDKHDTPTAPAQAATTTVSPAPTAADEAETSGAAAPHPSPSRSAASPTSPRETGKQVDPESADAAASAPQRESPLSMAHAAAAAPKGEAAEQSDEDAVSVLEGATVDELPAPRPPSSHQRAMPLPMPSDAVAAASRDAAATEAGMWARRTPRQEAGPDSADGRAASARSMRSAHALAAVSDAPDDSATADGAAPRRLPPLPPASVTLPNAIPSPTKRAGSR